MATCWARTVAKDQDCPKQKKQRNAPQETANMSFLSNNNNNNYDDDDNNRDNNNNRDDNNNDNNNRDGDAVYPSQKRSKFTW